MVRIGVDEAHCSPAARLAQRADAFTHYGCTAVVASTVSYDVYTCILVYDMLDNRPPTYESEVPSRFSSQGGGHSEHSQQKYRGSGNQGWSLTSYSNRWLKHTVYETKGLILTNG